MLNSHKPHHHMKQTAMKRTIVGGFKAPFKRPLPPSASSSSDGPPPPPPSSVTSSTDGSEGRAAATEEEDGAASKENVHVPATRPPPLVMPSRTNKAFIVPTNASSSSAAAPRLSATQPPKQQPQYEQQQGASSAQQQTKRFDANYTKNTAKKKKVFSEGILVLEPSPGASVVTKLTLESEAGKVEARKTLYSNGEDIGEGSEMIIGQYIVEVGAPRKPGAGLGGVDVNTSLPMDVHPYGEGGGGGGSFASRFMTKGMAKGLAGKGPAGAGGGAASSSSSAAAAATGATPAAAVVPRVVKEGELLLYDPALEQQQQSAAQQRPAHGTRLGTRAVVLDSFLGRALRPHQREGVAFLWRCLTGRGPSHALGRGCILADDMGLGKTLQTISVLYALLKQSPFSGQVDVQKAVVVTPSSLLGQWANEIKKWCSFKLPCTVVDSQLGKATGKGDAAEQIKTFVTSSPAVCPLLIISYETYRINAMALNACKEVGLLVADEAHRLKSGAESKTMNALAASPARARLLLTGTPIQNDLLEFYSLVNFVNPGALGPSSKFKSDYANPIAKSRDPRASVTIKEYGLRRSRELMGVAKAFLLRRTAQEILKTLIPPKQDTVVFVKPLPLQRRLYEQCVRVGLAMGGSSSLGNATGLRMVDVLRKLCNSPAILLPGRALGPDSVLTDDEVAAIFSSDKLEEEGGAEDGPGQGGKKKAPSQQRKSGGGAATAAATTTAEQEREENTGLAAADAAATSAKVAVLEALLAAIHAGTNERVVVVSSFTSCLDLVGALCRRHGWRSLRLDGSVAQSARTGLVEAFNGNGRLPLDAPRAPADPFVFLLSSRAGGMGLNLIGGSRLVLFDSEWNPAVDKQVKGRIWRDGQRRPCFIYRLLTVGTIEEKMHARSIAKEELHHTIMEDAQHDVRNFSPADLKQLFKLAPERVRCETYEMLRQGATTGARRWADYTGPADIKDACMRAVAEGDGAVSSTITFVHEEGQEGDGDAAPSAVAAAAAAVGGQEEEEETMAPAAATTKRRVIAVDDEEEGEGGEEEEEEEEGGEDEWVEPVIKTEVGPVGGAGHGGEAEEEDGEEEEWDALLNS